MKILSTQQESIASIVAQIRSQRSAPEDVTQAVNEILQAVKTDGDRALVELTERFDNVKLTTENLQVSRDETAEAYQMCDPKVIDALKRARKNIEIFHTKTFTRKNKVVESENGVEVWREFRPIEKVGLYVPGGKAVYPSTVLMLGTPARIAGCGEIVMCVPPMSNGSINPSVLVAADLCGIRKIYKVGGAQAIGAMAYGTESIPKVSKIFGPGNQYVTTAKMLVYGEVAIDMPAGPSEVAVIADEKANPAWIAADLLSQLEHGADSQAILITFSEKFARVIIAEMVKQMNVLPRKNIIEKSFSKSFAVVVRGNDEACDIINEYAPEHLEIATADESNLAKKINNAGSIFLGPYSTEPLGDYVTGANHTLPTSGFAKMFAPLSTESFGKMIQFQKISLTGIQNLRNAAETLAACEGLDAHKNAVTIRFL